MDGGEGQNSGQQPSAGYYCSQHSETIFSLELNEAKQRVCELCRTWYQEMPNTVHLFLLEIFMKNAHVTRPQGG